MVLSMFVATKAKNTHLISTAAHLASHVDRPAPSNDASSKNQLHNTGKQHSTITAAFINNGTKDCTNAYTSQKQRKLYRGR